MSYTYSISRVTSEFEQGVRWGSLFTVSWQGGSKFAATDYAAHILWALEESQSLRHQDAFLIGVAAGVQITEAQQRWCLYANRIAKQAPVMQYAWDQEDDE